MSLRWPFLLTLSLGILQVFAIPANGWAQPIPTNCRYESGIIRPTNDILSKGLKGPFLLLSLQADVDPAAPNQKAYVLWSRENTWLPVLDVKLPLYIARGETLGARPDFMPRGAVYTGCRM
jgi:hypothetical protein